MKTSNKILLGIIVIIFAVPLLLAYTLKNKIKKGEYTVEKNYKPGNQANMHSGSFTAFKVVKVVAPGPGFLTCHLKPSDKMTFKYYNEQKDSIIVSNSSDTLYITYIGEKGSVNNGNGRDNGPLSIQVNVPAFNNLVVDGAFVIIDSLPTTMINLSVTLKNEGAIKDGSKSEGQETSKVSPHVNNKKVEPSPVASTYKSEVVNDDVKGTINIFEHAKLEMPGFNMRDFLLSCLLERIG